MTPDIFKTIICHLKTIIDCLSPKVFYSNQLSNQLEVNNIQLFGWLLSNIWFIWQGRADIGRSVSWAQYLSLLPNKSDIGQAADQTTLLLFPPRILVYVSLTIMRSNYVKTYKPVHRAQLKKSSFNSQTFQWRSISRWFDQQGVGWGKSRDVISGHLGCRISKII